MDIIFLNISTIFYNFLYLQYYHFKYRWKIIPYLINKYIYIYIYIYIFKSNISHNMREYM